MRSLRHSELKLFPRCVAGASVVAALFLATTALPQSSAGPSGSNTSRQELTAGVLDGRKFQAGIVRAEADRSKRNAPLVDRLIFRNGKFSSEVCRRYNFEDAPYWVRREGDVVHFLVELKSPTDGVMVWKGTVRGDKLEGTMRWTKKRWYWTIEAEHKIRGKLETGPSAAAPPTN